MELNKNNLGLSLGILFAIVHLLWFIVTILGFGQQTLSWIIEGHFVKLNIEIMTFNVLSAFLTLIRAFIAGYLAGWLFAFIYNKFEARNHEKS